ncbi:RDD family protein [Simiduia agarivorans]|uniref:RDD domain-containing protein n=2 Tax=Simiduia TaxID=447467 RepID=K4KPP3_SIMAS|nr:RDD family protein [Simiduia agarivorans]AFV00196.2 RDD domain-containing protein [Simiduia agarivorans SA1 = DSM 21679]
MSNTPEFEDYTYAELLDAYNGIDAAQFPERKARVAELLQERSGAEAAVTANSDRYQTFGLRFLASIVDFLALVALATVLGTLFGLLPAWFVEGVETLFQFDVFFYSILLHWLYGKTFGKMVMNVKVVNYKDEGDITFLQAFLRDSVPLVLGLLGWLYGWLYLSDAEMEVSSTDLVLLFALSALGLFWFLLEMITMLFNEKRRALHDFIAGTVVIRVK